MFFAITLDLDDHATDEHSAQQNQAEHMQRLNPMAELPEDFGGNDFY